MEPAKLATSSTFQIIRTSSDIGQDCSIMFNAFRTFSDLDDLVPVCSSPFRVHVEPDPKCNEPAATVTMQFCDAHAAKMP